MSIRNIKQKIFENSNQIAIQNTIAEKAFEATSPLTFLKDKLGALLIQDLTESSAIGFHVSTHSMLGKAAMLLTRRIHHFNTPKRI